MKHNKSLITLLLAILAMQMIPMAIQANNKTMAFAFNLDPVLSGWIANLIFLVAGLITIMKTKT